MKNFFLRRTHKRFKVKDGAFAVLFQNSSKLGEIIDISLAGFSFRYSDSQFLDNDRDGQAFLYHDRQKQLEGFSDFDIFLVDSGIYLDKIPCKIISNFEIDQEMLEKVDHIELFFEVQYEGTCFDKRFQ